MLENVQNNVVTSKAKFDNVGKHRNNVVKMTVSENNKKKIIIKIECTEFKVLTTIS